MISKHVGYYINEEVEARRWTSQDLAERMGGNLDETTLAVDMLIHLPEPKLLLTQDMADRLGSALSVSPDFFINLDRMWRDSIIAAGKELELIKAEAQQEELDQCTET